MSPPAPPAAAGKAPRPVATLRLASSVTQALRRLAREHTALALTLLYAFLTIVGATYEFFLLMRFRINVLQFADVADFLLAAIRQPLTVLFTALPIVLLLILEGLSRGVAAVVPRYARYTDAQMQRPDYEFTMRLTYGSFMLIYFLCFTLWYSRWVAEQLRAGHGRPVTVTLQSPGVDGAMRLDGILLGTTARYVFVYEQADSTAHVVPVESMGEMVVRPRRGGPKLGR